MSSIMANLNLGQDVANKIERKQRTAHIVGKSYPRYQAIRMRRYGSLITSTPLDETLALFRRFFS